MSVKTVTSCYISLELKTKDSTGMHYKFDWMSHFQSAYLQLHICYILYECTNM